MLDVNRSARDASALVTQAWNNYNATRNTDLRLRNLDKVVALIENDFPARLYYVRLQNSLFDTHVNQESPHNRQGCFRHQVLLHRDRHVHDGSSGPPARVSEPPHVA